MAQREWQMCVREGERERGRAEIVVEGVMNSLTISLRHLQVVSSVTIFILSLTHTETNPWKAWRGKVFLLR